MNFVKKCALLGKCSIMFIVFLTVFFNGCTSLKPTPVHQLVEFRNAGPIQPEIDLDKLVAVRTTGTYCVIIGDVLEVQMASVLHVMTADLPESLEKIIPILCRVYDDGTIIVPVIGRVQALGRTLAEIETSIVEAYYPEYSNDRPSVIVRVAEYEIISASISGAVKAPGVYELPSDQRSLVSLIMKAGGIVDTGAAFIHIKQSNQQSNPGSTENNPEKTDSSVQALDTQGATLSLRQDPLTGDNTFLIRKDGIMVCSQVVDVTSESQRQAFLNKISTEHPGIPIDYLIYKLGELAEVIIPGSGSQESRENGNSTLTLPVKGLNIPFADVALQDGVSVEVEPLNPQVFTVVGLVKNSGVFPYPPSVQYNLMQALAFAGGVDEIADPRYVRVYRQKADGDLIDATFKLNGTSPVGAPTVMIKPGDVVAVEQTGRTHRNLMLAQILGVRASANYVVYEGEDLRSR